MSIDLDDLEAKARAATQGPWEECGHNNGAGGCRCGFVWSIPCDAIVATTDTDDADEGISSTDERKKLDAAFIAAANPAVVLALVRELRKWRNFQPSNEDLAAMKIQYGDGKSKAATLIYVGGLESRVRALEVDTDEIRAVENKRIVALIEDMIVNGPDGGVIALEMLLEKVRQL